MPRCSFASEPGRFAAITVFLKAAAREAVCKFDGVVTLASLPIRETERQYANSGHVTP